MFDEGLICEQGLSVVFFGIQQMRNGDIREIVEQLMGSLPYVFFGIGIHRFQRNHFNPYGNFHEIPTKRLPAHLGGGTVAGWLHPLLLRLSSW
jgi:hypothetical protein